MSNTPKFVFTKRKRTQETAEIMHRRLRYAKASLAIEGLHLTAEELSVFEECIHTGCTLEERTTRLKKHFPHYDNAVRA